MQCRVMTYRVARTAPPRSPPASLTQLTSVDVERGGAFFATAGLDKLVKLWRYDEGDLLAVGRGHASAITKVAIGPGNRVAVSGSEDGSLFVWDISTTLG